MNTRPNGVAPLPSTGNKGNKGGRVAQAWQEVWDRLDTQTWHEGIALADAVALSHDLKQATMLSHLSRMAQEGVLDRKTENVEVPVDRHGARFVSHRKRTFYRIAS